RARTCRLGPPRGHPRRSPNLVLRAASGAAEVVEGRTRRAEASPTLRRAEPRCGGRSARHARWLAPDALGRADVDARFQLHVGRPQPTPQVDLALRPWRAAAPPGRIEAGS